MSGSPNSKGWSPEQHLVKDAIAIFEDNMQEGGYGRSAPRLQQLLQRPDGLGYLAFVFSTPHPQFKEQTRLQMGIKLKNQIKLSGVWKALKPEFQAYVRRCCQNSMHPDQLRPIRKISSLVAAAVVVAERPNLDLLLALVRMFQDPKMVEQAFGAVSIVLDDFGRDLPNEAVNHTIKASITLLEQDIPNLQRPSLLCSIITSLNKLIVDNRMNEILPHYLQLVIRLAHLVPDPLAKAEAAHQQWQQQQGNGNTDQPAAFGVYDGPHGPRLEGLSLLLKSVCQTFVLLMDLRVEGLRPILKDVMGFMGQQTGSKSTEVALEACDFWRSFCENGGDPKLLENLLPKLMPVLLPRLQLIDMDLMLLGDENVNEDPPDRQVKQYRPDLEADIRPHIGSARSMGGGSSAGESSEHTRDEEDEWAEDNEDEDDDDEDDFDAMSDYSLRQAAVQALSRIAEHVPPESLWASMEPLVKAVLPSTPQQKDNPQTQAKLRSNWLAVEAVILALGGTSEGLRKLDGKYMSDISFLVNLVGFLSEVHPRPLVRSIACWTMVRYIPWVLQRVDSRAEQSKALSMFMKWIQLRMLDPNKRVQKIACSTFTRLVEQSPPSIVERNLESILLQTMKTFAVSQLRNRISIYVLLSQLSVTLMDHESFEKLPSRILDAVVNPLLYQMQQAPPQLLSSPGAAVSHCLALLECFRDLIEAIGTKVAPYAPQIYRQAHGFLRFGLLKDRAWQEELQVQQDAPFPEDALTGAQLALDLVSALATALERQGLERLFQAVQQPSSQELLELVVASLSSNADDVRQTAFAVVGDLSSLQQELRPFVQPILRNLFTRVGKQNSRNGEKPQLEREAVCNNACWAVRKLAADGHIPEQVYKPLLELLMSLLGQRKPSRLLVTNVADAVAQLALCRPDIVSGVMEVNPVFSKLWLKAALATHDTELCLRALAVLLLQHQDRMQHLLEAAKGSDNGRQFVGQAMKRVSEIRARQG